MNTHTFSSLEIKQAEHDFAEQIKADFGEVWRISIDGKYKGVSWDCRSPDDVTKYIWRLSQTAKHRGAKRAAGRIEVREGGSVLRFIILYDIAHLEVVQ